LGSEGLDVGRTELRGVVHSRELLERAGAEHLLRLYESLDDERRPVPSLEEHEDSRSRARTALRRHREHLADTFAHLGRGSILVLTEFVEKRHDPVLGIRELRAVGAGERPPLGHADPLLGVVEGEAHGAPSAPWAKRTVDIMASMSASTDSMTCSKPGSSLDRMLAVKSNHRFCHGTCTM